MSRRIRVRFAPSPTGELHIGNARTALFNYLFAKGRGGDFILRIEDTDLDRSAERHVASLLTDLKWLGLQWDEGPDVGGPRGPYRQTERLEIYKDFIEKLKRSGRAYPCYCSPEQLERERKEQLARGVPPRYSGRCRRLSERERRRLESQGVVPSLRFRVENGSLEVDDLIHGPIVFSAATIGDFIVVRSTGMPSYNFAVVVDDALMEITHVIRGEDHISNTPRQLLLYRFFGFPPPRFAHHGLILGRDRSKLSKRRGETTAVAAFRRQGYLPQALANYLVWLGNVFPPGKEVLSLDEMARLLDLETVSRKGAVFDVEKLNWFNAQHLHRLSPEEGLRAVTPFLEAAGIDPHAADPSYLRSAVTAVLPNMKTLLDAPDLLRPLLERFPAFSDAALDTLRRPESAAVFTALKEVLVRIPELDSGHLNEVLRSAMKRSGLRGKSFYMPLRLALTGAEKGPELDRILLLLGRDRILERLDRALGIRRAESVSEESAPPGE